MKIMRIVLVSVFAFGAAATSAAEAPTVLVAGANRGVGIVWAQKYAERGSNVVATARRPAQADALRSLAARTGRVRVETLGATDAAPVEALAERLADLPIDVLVNNAGMIGGEDEHKRGALDPELLDTYVRGAIALSALRVTERLLA